MDSEQQDTGHDQTGGQAQAEVRGVLISLELERRRRRLHLGGHAIIRSLLERPLKLPEQRVGTREPANGDVGTARERI